MLLCPLWLHMNVTDMSIFCNCCHFEGKVSTLPTLKQVFWSLTHWQCDTSLFSTAEPHGTPFKNRAKSCKCSLPSAICESSALHFLNATSTHSLVKRFMFVVEVHQTSSNMISHCLTHMCYSVLPKRLKSQVQSSTISHLCHCLERTVSGSMNLTSGIL